MHMLELILDSRSFFSVSFLFLFIHKKYAPCAKYISWTQCIFHTFPAHSDVNGTMQLQFDSFFISLTHTLSLIFFCVILFGRVCFARVEARNSIKYELLGNAWEQRWSMRTKNAGKSRILLITFLFASAGKNANTIIQILSFSAAKFNFYFKPEREGEKGKRKGKTMEFIFFCSNSQPTDKCFTCIQNAGDFSQLFIVLGLILW